MPADLLRLPRRPLHPLSNPYLDPPLQAGTATLYQLATPYTQLWTTGATGGSAPYQLYVLVGAVIDRLCVQPGPERGCIVGPGQFHQGTLHPRGVLLFIFIYQFHQSVC